jgi:RecA-family ATPase
VSELISITEDSLKEFSSRTEEEVLLGLSKGKVGYIISVPDSGKGYLCLSIAYELATTIPIIGLSTGLTPKKVLYWPIEDGLGEVAKRITKHLSIIDPSVIDLIKNNLSLWKSDEAISCSKRLISSAVDSEVTNNRNVLIEAAKDFDLVIIDTLREAAGTADEIEDDLQVKIALNEIAKKADVAILATHHLTKAAARGNEKVTSVSGSGFSKTLANSRMQLHLIKEDVKGKTRTLLTHIKANNIPQDNRFSEQLVDWSYNNLPFCRKDGLEELLIGTSSAVKNNDDEPVSFSMKDIKLSKESIRKAKAVKNKTGVFTDQDENAYEKWIKNKNVQ